VFVADGGDVVCEVTGFEHGRGSNRAAFSGAFAFAG
jgi:hypothetical protein